MNYSSINSIESLTAGPGLPSTDLICLKKGLKMQLVHPLVRQNLTLQKNPMSDHQLYILQVALWYVDYNLSIVL